MYSTGDWVDLLPAAEQHVYRQAQYGRRIGFGTRPAIVVIDAQNYMVGPPEGATPEYPSSCGQGAVTALAAAAAVLAEGRKVPAPIFFTRLEYRRDGEDLGVYARKRGLQSTIEGWCFEGTEGAHLSPLAGATDNDYIVVKKKPSAFFGTPFLAMLIDRQIDTLILMGGSTSNCVRATAVDAASHNFRTTVVEDCVFDRFANSHVTALFDLNRQHADVVTSAEVREYLASLRGSGDSTPNRMGVRDRRALSTREQGSSQ